MQTANADYNPLILMRKRFLVRTEIFSFPTVKHVNELEIFFLKMLMNFYPLQTLTCDFLENIPEVHSKES
jgi:hypothetical protein